VTMLSREDCYQITKGYQRPALLIISLEIVQARIIHLYARSKVLYCNCV